MYRVLVLTAFWALAACSSTAMMAKPDIVMQIPAATNTATACVAQGFGREFQDTFPSVEVVRDVSQISVNAPRGGLLAFVTVEPGPGGGSLVKFYNGDLYWPSTQTSGVFPDLARDNWHRAEKAITGCAKAA
jgi:hypothetical protein